MMINELLLEKYQTQKRLSEIANHDLTTYVSHTHFRVRELSAKLGLKLKYGTPGEPLQEIPLECIQSFPAIQQPSANYADLHTHNGVADSHP